MPLGSTGDLNWTPPAWRLQRKHIQVARYWLGFRVEVLGCVDPVLTIRVRDDHAGIDGRRAQEHAVMIGADPRTPTRAVRKVAEAAGQISAPDYAHVTPREISPCTFEVSADVYQGYL